MANVMRENLVSMSMRNQNMQSACRMCYLGAPIVWMMGTFYIGLNAVHVYARNAQAESIWSVVSLGLFAMLCALFSTSNVIHVCLQIPTSSMAAKLQRIGQALMTLMFTVLFGINLVAYLSQASNMDTSLKNHWHSFLLQTTLVYALLTISTISCFFA